VFEFQDYRRRTGDALLEFLNISVRFWDLGGSLILLCDRLATILAMDSQMVACFDIFMFAG
jgi:hypothetical protein